MNKYQFNEASLVIPRIRFQDIEYRLCFKRYRHGNTAIYLEGRNGLYAAATIDFPNIELEQNQVLVRQTLEGIDIPDLLHRAGIVEPIAVSAVRVEAAKLFRLSDAVVRYIAYQASLIDGLSRERSLFKAAAWRL